MEFRRDATPEAVTLASRGALCTVTPALVALLVAFDAVSTVRRVGTLAASELAAFCVVAFALGTCVAVPAVLLRRELHAWMAKLAAAKGASAGRGLRWHVAVTALDTTAFVAIASTFETLSGASYLQRAAIITAAALAYLAVRLFAERIPRLRKPLALALGVFVFLASLPFSWRFMDRTRTALDLAALATLAWLAATHLRVGKRAALVAAALSLASIAVAEPAIREASAARRLLHHDAPHARSLRYLLLPLLDWDGDRAPVLLGGVDCAPLRADVYPGARERPGDGIDQNCVPGDGMPRPASPGAEQGVAPDARSPDIVLLSIDALRWDAVHELDQTRRVLGPHTVFTRAVSPAPRTIDSLPATLRGRPMRMIEQSRHEELAIDAPLRDPHPTIGGVLAARGYRTLWVPTHRYLDPASNVAPGFEPFITETFAQLRNTRPGIGKAKPIVRASEVLARLLAESAALREPVLLWAHLMDTHEPYYWGERDFGPQGAAGYRHAVADLDAKLAAFLRAFEARRGRRPIVALWGDHGEEFGEHGGRHHSTSVHAEQVRVGFLLAGPGVPASRVQAPVATTVLPATLLELIGAPAVPSFVEPSVLACMSGRAERCPELAVSELRFLRRSRIGYTSQSHRLVYDPVFRIERLFDLSRDPYEQVDLAESAPAELARLRTLARQWDERH